MLSQSRRRSQMLCPSLFTSQELFQQCLPKSHSLQRLPIYLLHWRFPLKSNNLNYRPPISQTPPHPLIHSLTPHPPQPFHRRLSLLGSPTTPGHAVIERVSAKWTRTLIRARKPLEKTTSMEEILAGLATLVWHLAVRGDDRVTDCAFGLAFQSSSDVAPEGC